MATHDVIDDSRRAAQHGFKIRLDELENFVECYRQRTYNEEMVALKEAGGLHGVAEKLNVNLDNGINPTDYQQREDAFGHNKAEPHKRTPFCVLFIGVLQDFMLRLLLVCACISITFDVGFAEDDHER